MQKTLRASVLPAVALAVVAMSSVACAQNMRCATDKDTIAVTVGDRALLTYRSTPTPLKVYVKELYTPGGRQVLLDSPHDHIHHHALMYAVGAGGVDFWADEPKDKVGKQRPRSDAAARVTEDGDRRRATIEHTLDWTGPDQRPVLDERRRIVVYDPKDVGATLLTWSSLLRPAAGKDSVKLSPARHYFGLGLRPVRAMDNGTFLNPTGQAGETVRGTEKLVRADWCAYHAAIDGKPVTVAMFDHPENPRHPATWFTMTAPFGYLAATLNLHREPMTLQKGQTLGLTYGVALWDGKRGAEDIEKTYRRWLALAAKP